MKRKDIYLYECGCECPVAAIECPYLNGEGFCTLEEPWYDCDDFMAERWVEINNAEIRIDNGEAED